MGKITNSANSANSANEKGKEYKLPVNLENDMQKLTQEVKNSKNKNIFSRSTTYVTALIAALTMASTTPAFSQTPDKKLDAKNITIGVLDSLIIDVSKYYPNDKAYVQGLIDKFTSQELRDLIDNCLKETVLNQNFTEQERTIVIISCLEDINGKTTFSEAQIDFFEKNPAMIDATLAFRKKYDADFKALHEKFTKKLEEDEKKIEILRAHKYQNEQEMKEILSATTIETVKQDEGIQKAVQGIFDYYKTHDIKLTPHEQDLFNALPKK